MGTNVLKKDEQGNKIEGEYVESVKDTMDKYGCTDPEYMPMMQHYLLDYLYDGSTGFGGMLTKTAKDMLKEIKRNLGPMSDPCKHVMKRLEIDENGKKTWTDGTIDTLYGKAIGKTSPTFKYGVNELFGVEITLEPGVSLVNEETKEVFTYPDVAKVDGNTKFHFETTVSNPSKLKGKYEVKGRFPLDFQAVLVPAKDGVQDLVFYYSTDGATLELNIDWQPVASRAKIKKTHSPSSFGYTDALKGTEFTLYERVNATDTKKATVTIENGDYHEFDYDCEIGKTYVIKETKTNEGYEPMEEIVFTPDGNTEAYEFSAPNPSIVKLQLTKKSLANDEILALKGYSVASAEFKVYSDAACTKEVSLKKENGTFITVLKTDGSGKTPIVELPCKDSGTYDYYVKEVTPPRGHKINNTVFRVNVTLPKDSGVTKEVVVENEPDFAQVGALIHKKDYKGVPVEHAIFKVCYYNANEADVSKLEKTWYLESDYKGDVLLNTDYVARNPKSDSFYTHDGQVKLPISGYLTIQEYSVPANYILDDTVRGWKTTREVFEVKKILNTLEPVNILVRKFDSDGKTPLSRVSFTLKFIKASEPIGAEGADKTYAPLIKEGEEITLMTDGNGEIKFNGLDQGTYEITEIKTTSGHTLLKEPIRVTVPLVMTEEEAKAYGNNVDLSKAKKDSEDGKYHFFDLTYEITNSLQLKLPMTGATGTWKLGFVGVAMLMIAGIGLVVYGVKKKK